MICYIKNALLVYFGRVNEEKKQERIDSLCYLDSNQIRNYNCYEKFGIKHISYFFIEDSTKYIISNQNNELTIYIIEGDQLIHKKFLDISQGFTTFEHFIDSDKIYLLTYKNRLYIIDNEYHIEWEYIKTDKLHTK